MAKQRNDDWLSATQARLEEWGMVMRSVRSPCAGSVSVADLYEDRTLTARGSEIDSDIACQVDRYLCRLKKINDRVYRALFMYYYYEGNGNVWCAGALGISLNQFRSLRQNGEVFIMSAWDRDNETRASLQKSA